MIKTTSYEISEMLQADLEQAGYQTNVSFSIHISGTLLNHHKGHKKGIDKRIKGLIPCFTMGELWEMLPKSIGLGWIEIWDDSSSYPYLRYTAGKNEDNGKDMEQFYTEGETMIDVLVDTVLWCIENNHKLNLPKND